MRKEGGGWMDEEGGREWKEGGCGWMRKEGRGWVDEEGGKGVGG